MEKDVLVAFGDQIKIVKGVKWNTTAEDIIRRYKNISIYGYSYQPAPVTHVTVTVVRATDWHVTNIVTSEI